ncbi:hypothetical protein HA402_011048 [Bradysia odoriphaga]|nr:hypothetical protein HA402_011048 [Bradysia odoriphaga]
MGVYGKINILCAIFMICIILNDCFVSGKPVPIKRRFSPDENEEHIDNSVDRIRYDEYPLVVPKRAAVLLDRIMVALHHALEDGDQKEIRKISELYKDNSRYTGGRMQKIGKDFTLKFIPTSDEDYFCLIIKIWDYSDEVTVKVD